MGLITEIYSDKYITHEIALPVTTLERRWIKSILEDDRIKLFMTDETYDLLCDELADVKPLYEQNVIRIFDENICGDSFTDEYYQNNFRTLLNAAKNKKVLTIEYFSRNGNSLREEYLPYRLEYSKKEKRFRIIAFLMQEGHPVMAYKINISRIKHLIETEEVYDYDTNKSVDIAKLIKQRVNDEPLTIDIQKKYVDKLFRDFINYRCIVVDDTNDEIATIQIEYDKQDESELLIDILSYGSIMMVKGNKHFVELIKKRVNKQYELIYGRHN